MQKHHYERSIAIQTQPVIKKHANFYSILFLLFIAAGSLSAQFPDFTLLDNTPISEDKRCHLSGCVFDVDNDGDLDIYMTNFGFVGSNPPPTMFINERNGSYTKRGDFYPNTPSNYGSWPSPMGDIDSDGDLDLLAQLTRMKNEYPAGGIGIYLNDGFGFFTQNSTLTREGYYTGLPSLFDWNSDGALNLLSITERYALVFYNDGTGNFPDSDTSFLGTADNGGIMHSLALGDADNDGDFDAYQGFSVLDNFDAPGNVNNMLINTGDGFESIDSTHITLSDTAGNACAEWIDYDNDGDMDLYTTNITEREDGPLNALYENLGNLEFEKHVIEDPMYRESNSVSSLWGDLDNDGDLDLYVTVEDHPNPYTGHVSATHYNILYRNDGDGVFTNILEHPLAEESSHTAKFFD